MITCNGEKVQYFEFLEFMEQMTLKENLKALEGNDFVLMPYTDLTCKKVKRKKGESNIIFFQRVLDSIVLATEYKQPCGFLIAKNKKVIFQY